jgi:hypothetical protein
MKHKENKMNFKEYLKRTNPDYTDSAIHHFDSEHQLIKSHFQKLSDEHITFEARGSISPDSFEYDIEDFLCDRRSVTFSLLGEYK